MEKNKDFWNRHKIGTRMLLIVVVGILIVYGYVTLILRLELDKMTHESVQYFVFLAFACVTVGLNGLEHASNLIKKVKGVKNDNNDHIPFDR